jgi:metallo-beta-lactamase family protein
MASRALEFYVSRLSELDPELRVEGARGIEAFATNRLTVVASPQQSQELVASKKPSIVIASSGMATGGRVLYHLQAGLPDPRTTVLFVGFQAAGTRGRLLLEGATQLRMRGRDVPVAARIEQIDSMSAHADRDEIIRWLSGFARPPRQTFLVHGEPAALDALKVRIEATAGWPVHIARHEERVELDI